MLPVHLLDPLHGVGGQGGVEWDAGHGAAAQVADHVVDGLELLLQVAGVPAAGLGRLRLVIADLSTDPAEKDVLSYLEQSSYDKKVHAIPMY